MTDNSKAVQADQMRVKYGFWVVIFGLAVVCAVFLASINRWTTAAEVAAVVGSITGVVGTVVGAFFGVQVGSAGKEKAEAERKNAENKVEHLAAELDPTIANRIMSQFS